ncbi:MAG: hypothetical protein V1772_05580 [Chloroflexota bacterium]
MNGRSSSAGTRRRPGSAAPPVLVWIAALSLCGIGLNATPAPVSANLAVAPAPVVPREARVAATLADAADRMGWPLEITSRPDLRGETWQVAAAGGAERALISVVASSRAATHQDDLRAQGLILGLYRGREAVISRPGDALAQGRGVIAWRCGPYTLAAYDDTGVEREDASAAALADAAAAHDLCGLPPTLVIRGETADVRHAGSNLATPFAKLSDDYYRANAYGRVAFAFTVVDGPAENGGWFPVGDELSVYAGAGYRYGEAAIQRAVATLDPPEIGYVERAIVLVPDEALSRLTRDARPRTYRECDGRPMPIALPGRRARVELLDLVLLSEDSTLGEWVHELGHTLYSQVARYGGLHRLHDRYCCGQPDCALGRVGVWDLMGLGSGAGLWRMSPTHMSSFTKEEAGWLAYAQGEVGREHTLTAVEHQRAGDPILTLADPLSDDPRRYYVLEAREAEAQSGGPLRGVMVYHVTPGTAAEGPQVVALPDSGLAPGECDWGPARPRPSLYGLGEPDGRTRLELPGGLAIELVAEAHAPYRAMVRMTARDSHVHPR